MKMSVIQKVIKTIAPPRSKSDKLVMHCNEQKKTQQQNC